MDSKSDSDRTIDATRIPAQERKMRIFREFNALKPLETLQVIAGHEPDHLLSHMEQEGLPVDVTAYHSRKNADGTYTGYFTKTASVAEGTIQRTGH